MKNIYLFAISIHLISSLASANNVVTLQCSRNGNNTFTLLLNEQDGSLNVAMFNQINYGKYPQAQSTQPDTMVFSKKPANTNNGIPMRFEIPAQVMTDTPYRIQYTIRSDVSKNWPGPIREDIFYTYYLNCIKVKEFTY